MSTPDEKVLEKAASQMTEHIKRMQKAQLRLRAAEIVFVNGSQSDKTNFGEVAERLVAFAMK